VGLIWGRQNGWGARLRRVRAGVLTEPGPAGTGPLVVGPRHDPVAGPGEVLLQVEACGVCRTDLQLAEGDLPAHRLPIVPGHQIVGTVVAHGDDVYAPEIGARVGVAWIASTCGTCRFCLAGVENLCEFAEFTGLDVDGGFAEQVVARADFTYPLPDGVEPIDVAPLLCGGAIGYRCLRVGEVQPGAALGLYGFGASATCVIQVARHRECDVYVCTRSSAEQERARALGAAWAGGYDELPPVPLDVAITFAPVGSVVVDALRAVRRGGIVVVNAIHLDEIPAFPYELLWWERQLRSVANVTRRDVTELLALAARIPIRTQVDAFALDDVNEALARLSGGGVSGAAVVSP
jgi:alcohol dehydrogenase, propanol-preferring